MIPPKETTGREVEREIPKVPRHPKTYWANIPKHEVEALARCLLPDIQAYYQSEQGKEEFKAWQAEQSKTKKLNLRGKDYEHQ